MFFTIKTVNKQLCFIFLVCSNLIFSQEITESKFWSSASYIYQPKKKLTLSISQLYRLKNDLNAVDSYISEISSDYSIAKNLNFEIELRYYSKNDNQGKVQGYENWWRYRLAVERELKLKPIKLYLRFAYQRRSSLDKKNDFKDYLRLRTAFEYSIKNWDWDPYFSFEFFNKTTGSDLEKKRFGIGSSNKIKGSKWTLRYFYQVNRGNSKENFHIFLLKYRYKQKAKSLIKQKDKKTPNKDV